MSQKDEDGTPATPEEKARAQRLARLVDDMLAGEPAPPALEAEERALLETATAIHAAMGTTKALEPAHRSRLIEAAFVPAAAPAPSRPRPASWLRRRGPWLAAAVSAAAAIVLVLIDPVPRRPASSSARPSPDQLIGRIDEEESGDASRRLDVLYADRLSGYRSAKLGGTP